MIRDDHNASFSTSSSGGGFGAGHSAENKDNLDESFVIMAEQATTTGAPLSFDDSHTSFEDQLRIARERERRRVEGAAAARGGLRRGNSVRDRLKAFNNSNRSLDTAGSNNNALAPTTTTTKKIWKPPMAGKPSHIHIDTAKQATTTTTATNKAHPTGHTDDSSLNESLDLSHVHQHDDDCDDTHSATSASTSNLVYTGDSSFTSYDEQIRLARQREAKRRAAASNNSRGGGASVSSLKDRMAKFSMSTGRIADSGEELVNTGAAVSIKDRLKAFQ